MEELLDLASSFQVSETPNDTASCHPRFALYKVRRSSSSQEERRRKFLKEQKQKRHDYVMHTRCLLDGVWTETSDPEDDQVGERMDWVPHRQKRSPSYKNQLMLSEWLVEVPPDMAENWLLVLCPVGKRCLVVASKGSTKAYARSGYLVGTFPTFLPGGNKKQKAVSVCTILDCIYNELDGTYYILDLMCWKSQPLYDSETEFRFYWLNTKLEEIPEVKQKIPGNRYQFVPLPSYSGHSEKIQAALFSPMPFPSKLDGLLFYHKKTHYTFGVTPLVGWLKAYMVPELLQIPVPIELCADRPASYQTMEQHLKTAFAKQRSRKLKMAKKNEKQEVLVEEGMTLGEEPGEELGT